MQNLILWFVDNTSKLICIVTCCLQLLVCFQAGSDLYAFVEFEQHSDAQLALMAMNKRIVLGRVSYLSIFLYFVLEVMYWTWMVWCCFCIFAKNIHKSSVKLYFNLWQHKNGKEWDLLRPLYICGWTAGTHACSLRLNKWNQVKTSVYVRKR